MSRPVFNHVSVTCSDFDRSLAFYHDLVGLEISSQGLNSSPELNAIIGLGEVRLRFAELDLGNGGFLELFEYLQPRGQVAGSRTCDHGNVHFAVTVDDIDQIYRRLIDAGVTTRSAPVTLARGDWKGARVFYSVDPDGVTVEFIQFPDTMR